MDKDRVLAEAVKLACIRAAQLGYEQASISGLCAEGALEAAIGAVRMVDVEEIVRKIKSGT
jgi:hypothetical protein